MVSSKLSLVAEVLMPCPFDFILPALDNFRELIQFRRWKPAVIRQGYRPDPEFGAPVISHYMHMRRLTRISLIGKKEEPVSLMSEYYRHAAILAKISELTH
jgi:hypothetical protein